jgi:hypothetical protein
VRVRDVVTELRTFAAKSTYVCHDFTPKQNLIALELPIRINRLPDFGGVAGTSGFETADLCRVES